MFRSSSKAENEPQAAKVYPNDSNTETANDAEIRFLQGVYAKAEDLQKERAEQECVAELIRRYRKALLAYIFCTAALLIVTAVILAASDFSMGAVFVLSFLWMGAATLFEQLRLNDGQVVELLRKVVGTVRLR
ncbi:hypothetical protein [Paenibacillus sp. MBLB4367]|uniref:hypothetical protein n=1 Tax=Paenibacillus sp. MBLB4367 TaxID=3384767 RepID=UPI0039081CA1